jgi:hypothetical protein
LAQINNVKANYFEGATALTSNFSSYPLITGKAFNDVFVIQSDTDEELIIELLDDNGYILDENLLDLAKTYGPEIELGAEFPEKTNVEFIKIKSYKKIQLCVWERGCGITLACGTGACASVVACVLNNLTESKVKVNLLGGAVNVEWCGTAENPKQDIFLIGPAEYSFIAEYML